MRSARSRIASSASVLHSGKRCLHPEWASAYHTWFGHRLCNLTSPAQKRRRHASELRLPARRSTTDYKPNLCEGPKNTGDVFSVTFCRGARCFNRLALPHSNPLIRAGAVFASSDGSQMISLMSPIMNKLRTSGRIARFAPPVHSTQDDPCELQSTRPQCAYDKLSELRSFEHTLEYKL